MSLLLLSEDQKNSLPIVNSNTTCRKKNSWIHGSDGLLVLGEKMRELCSNQENDGTLLKERTSSHRQEIKLSKAVMCFLPPLPATTSTSILPKKEIIPSSKEDLEERISSAILDGSLSNLQERAQAQEQDCAKKKHTPPPKERSVHFSAAVQCRYIESRRKMLKRLKSQGGGLSSYWYDDDEIECMHNELMETVRIIQARESFLLVSQGRDEQRSHQDEDDDDCSCVRGLERFRLRDGQVTRSLQDRKDSIYTVLCAQSLLRKENDDDDYHDGYTIAIAYRPYSLRCQRLAYNIAKRDEAYVNQRVR